MLARRFEEAEENVWQSMSSIVDRMTGNPRLNLGAELLPIHGQIRALRTRQLDEVSSLETRLAQTPQDGAAKWLLEERTERLADLQIAETILTALLH